MKMVLIIVRREVLRMQFIKETIGIILIILFVIIIEIITMKVTNNSLNRVNDELELIESESNENELKSKINNFSNSWKNEEKKLSCFMEHNELEEITKEVNSLVFAIENGKKETIKEKLDNIKFKMEHIKNKQKIKIENIF